MRWRELGRAPEPTFYGPLRRRFVAYLYFVGWAHLSLGLHVHLSSPNVEVHLPFCFIRVGWQLR